ncbi:MAG: type I methionyl aminopeptidase [Candidatus Andersenbacteria bacterium]|nr:type I methionyl aminopeptidase [Candidatus Andersenbacteria bacterium]
MIRLKTDAEIARLARGGALLAAMLEELCSEVRAGVTPRQLDARARELVARARARPSFLDYAPKGSKPYPAALCVSVNRAVVHGLPNDVPLAEGDVVGIDLGLVYEGMYVDSARTVGVGRISPEAQRLIAVTREALARGIAQARAGQTVGDIGAAVQAYVEANDFSVVRALVGHGVGYAVHEDPRVPNFGIPGKGVRLETGLVIAIEPMVTFGGAEVITAADGWTVETKGGGLAAHEEHTVAVTAAGPRVLTLV